MTRCANRRRRLVGCVGMTLLALLACSDVPTQPTEQRVLGLVAFPGGRAWFPGVEANPRAWIVEDRRIRVEITTEGFCDVVRPDWDVTITDGFIDDEGFVFILPYEVRSNRCDDARSPTREGTPWTLFTDTLDVEFETALEARVRVVSGDGQVFDRELDFHPGWPPDGGG